MIRLSKSTVVLITRYVKAFRDSDPQEHGPMTIKEAEKKNHFTTSSGTVDVEVKIVEGTYEGEYAFRVGNSWGVKEPEPKQSSYLEDVWK